MLSSLCRIPDLSFIRKGLWQDYLLLVFLLSGCGVLWITAWHSWWHFHIVVDPVVYWARASAFLSHGYSWDALGYNEYQPGALWFFAGVGLLAGKGCDFENFLTSLMLVNLVIFSLHVGLARVLVSRTAAFIMVLLAVLVGPILLCRFELLVSLMVLITWVFWSRAQFLPAAVLLGAATASKLYPVLLLPLLISAAWRKSQILGILTVSTGWLAGGLSIVGGLWIFGGSWRGVLNSVKFHLDKPFGVDGLLGSLIPIGQYLVGIPLRMTPRNGIHGFEPGMGDMMTLALGWVWVLAVGVVGLLILRRNKDSPSADPLDLFLLLGWYVLLGKLTAPQYVWWALPFLALSFKTPYPAKGLRPALVTICCALLISQLVYPVYYSEFLSSFSHSYWLTTLFWANVIKNLLWLFALIAATCAWLTLGKVTGEIKTSRKYRFRLKAYRPPSAR